jgi:two-component system NtrC family sensor kinase
MFRFIGPGGWPSLIRLRWFLGRSLTVKILVASAVMVLPLSGGFWYRSLLIEKRLLTASAVDFAGSFAELLRKSIHEDMLGNRRGEVQRTIASVTGSESLRAVRIYNPRGTVVYASDPADVGHTVVKDEQPCIGCHDDPSRPRETLHETHRSTVFNGPDGHRVLSFIEPIFNEPDCSSAACHVHAESARVLGVLLAEFPLTRLDHRVERQVVDFSIFVVFYFIALGTMGYVVLWRIVLRPVGALAAGVEKVAAGDLTKMVAVASQDEIGRLAGNFNAMTMELAASRRRMERLAEGLERQVAEKTAEVRHTEGRLAVAERLAALGRLTAEIAHEIRNPLTSIGGYARRLQRIVTGEQEKEYTGIVVAEASRLEQLLRDVLDFSRPARYELRRQSLVPIVREALAAFGDRFAERDVHVVADLAAQEPVFVDAGHVRRAVDNLVANATDAMPPGGTLHVSTRRAAARCLDYVVIAIEDNGPGIPEADLERLFEPFWTTKKMGEGTGLGLPITRKIAEAHGGFITITNRQGGGLVSTLWFPYQDDATLARPPCWEEMRCGRARADALDRCPAWPDFGHACWAVAGTLNEGPPHGTDACNLGDCADCGFFRSHSHRDGR